MKFPRSIYTIKNVATGKVYVGSSANVEKRFAVHLSMLKNKKHPVELMQEDYDTYGKELVLTVVETITKFKDRYREYELMEALDTGNPEYGYNYKDQHFTKRKGYAL